MYVGQRDLRRAKGRFALVATVVTLITLLTVVLSGLTAGLASDSASAVRALPGTDIVFSDRNDEGPSFGTSRVATDTVADLAATTQAEGLGISRGTLETDNAPLPVVVFGIPVNGMQADALGNPDLSQDTIVVSSAAIEEAGLEPGDEVVLAGEGQPRTVIAGPKLSHSHSPVAWIDLSSWQSVTSSPDAVTVALVDNPAPAAQLELSAGLVVVPTDSAESAISSFSEESLSLNLIRGFLLGISALVVGAFFTVWTIQRTRDIAVLKALGASNGYLLRDSLGQAALLLILAGLIGAAAGTLAGLALGSVAPFTLSLATVGVPVAISTSLGLVGAAIAIRKITSVDPVTALGAAR